MFGNCSNIVMSGKKRIAIKLRTVQFTGSCNKQFFFHSAANALRKIRHFNLEDWVRHPGKYSSSLARCHLTPCPWYVWIGKTQCWIDIVFGRKWTELKQGVKGLQSNILGLPSEMGKGSAEVAGTASETIYITNPDMEWRHQNPRPCLVI